MVYQVIGTQRKEGVYMDRPYDNTMLYVTAEAPNVNGYYCTSLKVKTELLPKSLELGDEVEVYYNRFQNIEAVHIKKKGEKECLNL